MPLATAYGIDKKNPTENVGFFLYKSIVIKNELEVFSGGFLVAYGSLVDFLTKRTVVAMLLEECKQLCIILLTRNAEIKACRLQIIAHEYIFIRLDVKVICIYYRLNAFELLISDF